MPRNNAIPADLQMYVEQEILPRYDHFDAAHRRDHARMVIEQSLELAARHDADPAMAYAIAAFHDLGLVEGRDTHHLASARIIKADKTLRNWFSESQIQTMADAAEDHRASAKRPPRSLYGRIVAEADRFIDPENIVRRTVQFGFDHYPELTQEEHYQRTLSHLHEKYGRGGYLRLWFPDSPNAQRLEQLWELIDDEPRLHALFLRCYQELSGPQVEEHPLQPFLPQNGRILFLGSFPPPKTRWSMDFFYPNWINDFWRIMGIIAFDNAAHFEVKGEKRFDRERIIRFCNERGLAFYDTATQVRRLKGNASDEFLEIVEQTDIEALLVQMPDCHSIVTTGGKASEQLARQFEAKVPPVGGCVLLRPGLRWWRMPSTSRAYPMKKEKKAEHYASLISEFRNPNSEICE